jgi:diguanylate cyclase (GGDEF)-like protein/PAS domain S-box-containing protein
LRLASCFFFVTSATVFVGLAPEANLIWVANGVLLAYLLLAPKKRWPAYLSVAYIAQFSGGLLAGHHGISSGLILTFLNVAESLVSAMLLRRRTTDLPDFTRPSYLVRFLLYGVLAGPALLGAVDALLSPLWHTASPLWHIASRGSEFLKWFTADALGVCVATPACVAIFRGRMRATLLSFRHWAYLLPVLACAVAVFCQARLPMPFLIYPLLVLVLLRLSLGWAALSTLFVSGIASYFTVRGHGPFAVSSSIGPIESPVLLQIFIAAAMVVLYSVSVFLESLRAAERRLLETAALHKLVTENSRDIIIIADFEGHRNLVSAAGANWSGWSQEEMLHLDSLSLVHPDDQPKMAETIRELRAGKDDALAECRVRIHDGSYVWIEASLRTIRDPHTGVPTGILNNVREITQRKLAEQQLAEAYHAVEALAITDALTGLANRRCFDQCLTTEWRRGMRERNPLSIVLIDADLFKSYNDTYGHLRGDNCLKQIAEAIQDVVARPGDLVARFGGEEFAVVLPNTPAPGAFQIAQEICAAMRNRQLPHSGNPVGIVTISAGCATLVPQLGQHAPSLIDCADRALYQAKANGRNCAIAYRPGTTNKFAIQINHDESQDLVALKSA